MVIDTSALLCILFGEPEAAAFAHAMATPGSHVVSAFSVLEATAVVTSRKGEAAARELDLLLHRTRVDIVPFTPEQLELARAAWTTFGKGRHPAALNIGDCCTYALAKYRGEPLLFKGDGFSQTNITPALSSGTSPPNFGRCSSQTA